MSKVDFERWAERTEVKRARNEVATEFQWKETKTEGGWSDESAQEFGQLVKGHERSIEVEMYPEEVKRESQS